MKYSLNSRKVAEATEQCLKERGVKKRDIAELVLFLQKDYIPGLTLEEVYGHMERVLAKREVQNAILTGIQLDVLAEQGKLMQPLQDIIYNDEPLYGCDEILALSIVNVYGSIGFTNYGYIDKKKQGVLSMLNDKNDGKIHTFLDDIVGAIAAATSSKIAHGYQAELEKKQLTESEDANNI
ncbi:phosphatidylglycerophosphatase [Paenibacillus swuensis]|uniref:Phosphatidylglycerophosphatase n=1 Tax=Paenibacillus swuensis TaxID=1178515 RepID=A0A172TJB4_9BACL|nr:phosphatidylglycerophosphatase [Paenibacillus swuensis]